MEPAKLAIEGHRKYNTVINIIETAMYISNDKLNTISPKVLPACDGVRIEATKNRNPQKRFNIIASENCAIPTLSFA